MKHSEPPAREWQEDPEHFRAASSLSAAFFQLTSGRYSCCPALSCGPHLLVSELFPGQRSFLPKLSPTCSMIKAPTTSYFVFFHQIKCTFFTLH